MSQCTARRRKTIRCEGKYVPSEGLCLRHAVLFDVWIDNGGFRVYAFNPKKVENPTIGDRNPGQLRRWKRAQFHKWLDRLTEDDVQRIMNS